jgi:RNA polymerase sigma-70 factor (ECF subfamily)
LHALSPDPRSGLASAPAICTPCALLRQNEPMDLKRQAAGAVATGDTAGLADLYAELRKSLLAFLRKHAGDADIAEDLLHDVVVRALAAGQDEAHAPRNLTGWLYAVARNAAMDHHRRNRPTEELPDDLDAPTPDDDEAAVTELANCLRPMVERLPATYRATLIAAELDGLSLADVAKAQGLSLAAVKTRASRGRRLLQQELVECCRVALSARGEVLDYDVREAAKCGPAASACASSTRKLN